MGSVDTARWPRLVLGVATLLFAGVIYAWSIIKAPFELMSDGIVINASQLGVNYTLTVIFFCIGSFTSGQISGKTTSTQRLIISAVLLFSGFFTASILIAPLREGRSFIPLYLTYGVLAGVGIGFAYNTVIGTTNMWFPDKQGFCSGVLLLGFGMSSLIIGRIADFMGNSDAIGWRSTYVCFAVAIGLILLIAAFLVKPPPAGMVFPAPKASKSSAQSEEVRDYSTLEMIRRKSFVLIFIYTGILSASGSAAIGFAKDIVQDAGATAGFAVTAVGILAVFNGFGRLSSGWLFDNIGLKRTQFVSSLVNILAPLTVVLALAVDSLFLCVSGVCLCGLAYGFAPTTASVFAARFYGQKNFSKNFGILNLILVPAPFAATLAGRVKDSTGGFISAFLILSACAVAGFFINLGIKKP